MNKEIIIPTVDEIINLHKKVVLDMIEELKHELTKVENHYVTLKIDDEQASFISNALEFYKKKYE